MAKPPANLSVQFYPFRRPDTAPTAQHNGMDVLAPLHRALERLERTLINIGPRYLIVQGSQVTPGRAWGPRPLDLPRVLAFSYGKEWRPCAVCGKATRTATKDGTYPLHFSCDFSTVLRRARERPNRHDRRRTASR